MEDKTLEEEQIILDQYSKRGYLEGYYDAKMEILGNEKEVLAAYKSGYINGKKARHDIAEEHIQQYLIQRSAYIRRMGYANEMCIHISTDKYLSDRDKYIYKQGVLEAEQEKLYMKESFDDYLEYKREKAKLKGKER